MNQPKDFPYTLPEDEDVEIRLDLATVRLAPESDKELFCSICTLPMSFRVRIVPCGHFICPECYKKYSEDCKFCGFEIADVVIEKNSI